MYLFLQFAINAILKKDKNDIYFWLIVSWVSWVVFYSLHLIK